MDSDNLPDDTEGKPKETAHTKLYWGFMAREDIELTAKVVYCYLWNYSRYRRYSEKAWIGVYKKEWVGWLKINPTTLRRAFVNLTEKKYLKAHPDNKQGAKSRYKLQFDPVSCTWRESADTLLESADTLLESAEGLSQSSDKQCKAVQNILTDRPKDWRPGDSWGYKILTDYDLVDDLEELDYSTYSTTNIECIERFLESYNGPYPEDAIRVAIERVQEMEGNGTLKKSPKDLLATIFFDKEMDYAWVLDWDQKHNRDEEDEDIGFIRDPSPLNEPARSLLSEFDTMFPDAAEWAYPKADLDALILLLSDKGGDPQYPTGFGRTSEEIRAVFHFLRNSGNIEYWARPYRLTKRVSKGKGSFGIEHIEFLMRLAKKESNARSQALN